MAYHSQVPSSLEERFSWVQQTCSWSRVTFCWRTATTRWSPRSLGIRTCRCLSNMRSNNPYCRSKHFNLQTHNLIRDSSDLNLTLARFTKRSDTSATSSFSLEERSRMKRLISCLMGMITSSFSKNNDLCCRSELNKQHLDQPPGSDVSAQPSELPEKLKNIGEKDYPLLMAPDILLYSGPDSSWSWIKRSLSLTHRRSLNLETNFNLSMIKNKWPRSILTSWLFSQMP